jgi:hypothetical protein
VIIKETTSEIIDVPVSENKLTEKERKKDNESGPLTRSSIVREPTNLNSDSVYRESNVKDIVIDTTQTIQPVSVGRGFSGMRISTVLQ